jgi:hypothetical protein
LFRHDGSWFAIARVPEPSGGGTLLRSPNGCDPFEPGFKRELFVRVRAEN